MAPYYEAGKYRCLVLSAAIVESSAKKTPQVALKVRVNARIHESWDEAGEYRQEDETVPNEYERTVYMALTETGIEYVVKKLRNAGFIGQTFDEVTQLVGQQIACECRHEDYNGKTSERWDLPFPIEDSAPLQHNADVARRVNALFGKALKAPNSAAQRPAAVAVPASGGAALDDDIPF